MNRQIRRLAAALLVCYLALFVQLNVVQVLRAEEYEENPANTRDIVRDFTRPRGAIQTWDGVLVAESVPSGDRFERQRRYPLGDLYAHLTGFFSFEFGTDGVERSYNDELAGRTAEQQLDSLRDLFVDRVDTGDVTLTVQSTVQEAARAALGAQQGSVVALDPRTGAVLAMWSWPSFDPNALAGHDFAAVRDARALLLLAEGNPLVPAAYRERYFPGSTFKVVTAATGVESGLVTPTQPVYPVEAQYTPPQTTRPLGNFGGSSCGGTLFDILRVSCTTAFARMGIDLGADRLFAGAGSFGFNDRPPLDLPAVAESVFPPLESFRDNAPALAQSAFGQNSVQATPLQIAMVSAALANGGTVMAPHVVAEVRDGDGDLVSRATPTPWRQAVSAATSAVVRDAMVQVVQAGTATRLQIPGVSVAAKTGTAQLGTEPPSSHAWITAFAPVEAPRVAVAVIVEGQPGASEQTGGRVAAPIARAVIEAVLAMPDPTTSSPTDPSVG